MKKGTRDGFSLTELVLVLFLMGLVIWMVSQLTTQTFTTLRFLQEKAQTSDSASLGLERICSEMREAVVLESLDPLKFQKVDPSAPFALDYDGDPSRAVNPGEPDFSVNPSDWSSSYSKDAFDKNHLGRVTYERVNGVLSRTVEKGAQKATSDVAVGVNDFSVVRGPEIEGVSTADNVFLVSLSIQEDRRVLVLQSVVSVPGLAR